MGRRHRILPDFFDRVLPLVDRTIAILATEKFRSDPIGGDGYSRMTSVISSAYKRHNLSPRLGQASLDCRHYLPSRPGRR